MMKGKYIGTEFPEFKGKDIEIVDDNSEPSNPCYKIKFIGNNEWIDNMSDEDIEFDCEHHFIELNDEDEICKLCGQKK